MNPSLAMTLSAKRPPVDHPARLAPGAGAPDGTAAEAPPVLLVEDDQAIAALLRFILEREGMRVVHAADGRAAGQAIATLPPPRLVLLDIMLPYVDGFDLVGRIRARADWADCPVLMLSSRGGERDIARALDAGADDYLLKPFQPEELKARLRRLLRGRR